MIERLYGDYYACCDGCGRELDGTSEDLDGVRDSMKANGWKIRRIGSDWYDYCPACAPKCARPGPDEFSGT